MQCKDWTISNYTGSASTAKQVIVHHKKLNLKVKFVDMLTYLQPMELKQAAKDFSDGYDDRKGLKWITGGLSNVMHRVSRSGIDFIKRLWYDKDNKKVTVLTTDHRITHVVGVDFNSLYPNVMSSELRKFIKYIGGKMYMSGSLTGKIEGNSEHSKLTVLRIINSNKRFKEDGQLFIAEVKGHIDQNYYGSNCNTCALQNTVVPLVQKPPSVPRLFAPHKIGFLAEQLTDPSVAPLVAPVLAITVPLKDNVFPSALIYYPLSAQTSYPTFTKTKPKGFAPLFPVDRISRQLSILPEFVFGSLSNYILLHQIVGCLLILIHSLNVPLTDGITYTNI
ncbi:MAG: hypothetical protein EZS28_039468 [Streblomastix strix]|uniref:Uncharacterized protein n=1 Tax=Streblomastix strix TaxID=222440 RepID=A0A5J4U5P6_9EUKA|nr:MAG: hypothetical protein EZS28_039468 [Streblomastix strix]